MKNILRNFTDNHQYFESLKESKGKYIPIRISSERQDLLEKMKEINTNNFEFQERELCDFGYVISNEVIEYNTYPFLCKDWIDLKNISGRGLTGKSLLIIGLYKDFTQEKVLDLLNKGYKAETNIYFLLGRDLSSLSWLLAKQLIGKSVDSCRKATFSLLNLNKFSIEDWDIYGSKSLHEKNIKELVENNLWDTLVFHGHGKEDHLNLDDYTLTGLNKYINYTIPNAPAIGHKGQSFFKDANKAIDISTIKVNRLFLLSCNNLPFFESRLYDSKYSLVLDAIDGWSKEIIASIAVQSADTPELKIVLNNYNHSDIALQLNKKLEDIQPFISIIHIGLPEKISDNSFVEQATPRLSKQTRTVLSRISNYYSSTMLDDDHPITKMAHKIMGDYMQLTRRGTAGSTIKDMQQFESNLTNRVNPFSKKMAQIMFEDQDDNLHNFDSFNTYRARIDSNSINNHTCSSCGATATSCTYLPEISSIFQIDADYCYKCGDKSAQMTGMPYIEFTCDDYNKKDLSINYKISVTSQESGDVFIGIQLPSYVEGYVKNKLSIQKLKFKSPNLTKEIEGTINFSEETVLQSYYLKMFAIQNGGIAVNRCFFNLI
ncbi:hypothetical protein [Companilactobacillus sp. FL22-1]|uniref:hypothetical protein n=1 Tax=Companilactobacillus sp. FL22-1 TaxID=3373892 RepID=UPI00375509C6